MESLGAQPEPEPRAGSGYTGVVPDLAECSCTPRTTASAITAGAHLYEGLVMEGNRMQGQSAGFTRAVVLYPCARWTGGRLLKKVCSVCVFECVG